jgi:hypothetical protein
VRDWFGLWRRDAEQLEKEGKKAGAPSAVTVAATGTLVRGPPSRPRAHSSSAGEPRWASTMTVTTRPAISAPVQLVSGAPTRSRAESDGSSFLSLSPPGAGPSSLSYSARQPPPLMQRAYTTPLVADAAAEGDDDDALGELHALRQLGLRPTSGSSSARPSTADSGSGSVSSTASASVYADEDGLALSRRGSVRTSATSLRSDVSAASGSGAQKVGYAYRAPGAPPPRVLWLARAPSAGSPSVADVTVLAETPETAPEAERPLASAPPPPPPRPARSALRNSPPIPH